MQLPFFLRNHVLALSLYCLGTGIVVYSSPAQAQETVGGVARMNPVEQKQYEVRRSILQILGGRGAVILTGGTAAYYPPDGLKVKPSSINLGLFHDVNWGFKIWFNKVIFANDNGSQFFRFPSGGAATNRIYKGNYSSAMIGYSVFEEKWLRVSPFFECGPKIISVHDGVSYSSFAAGGGIEVSQAIPLGFYETPKVQDIFTTWLMTVSMRASYMSDYYWKDQAWNGGFFSVRLNVGIGLQSDMIDSDH